MGKYLLLIKKNIAIVCLLASISIAANSQAPQQPTGITPLNGTTNYSANTVTVTVTDPNGDPMTVKLYGRKKTCTSTAPNFTIIGLPDTQFYTEELPGTNSMGGGSNVIFKAQTQWVANHRIDSNIAFLVQLGDCVQNGDTPPGIDDQIEWKRADTSIKIIEFPNVPITDGIPYGMCVGNHDQSVNGSPTSATKYYNQYFGSARFAGRGYYGGQYGANGDNHYELFSSGGIDFIHISIEYYPDASAASLVTLQPVLDWADALLKAYPARKGILSSHQLIGTTNLFQGPGQKIYDDLKDNPNLFLMLCGHVPGEGRRQDTYNGNTIYTILSDYQSGYTNGGNGYLRIMEFRPAQGIMDVKTYSPYSNTSFTGATSQFTVPVTFQCPFTLIGTNTSVTSGNSTTFTWPGLQLSTDYEWYVTIDDGNGNITTSSINGFKTWNGSALTSAGSLRFKDTTYVNLGNAPELQLTNFTLEAWVKIEGYGSTTKTEAVASGLVNVIPIITKGRDEGDGTVAKDINYFLGYQPGFPGTSTNKLVADFEDASSINHPVISSATIPMNTWTHVGASFDVATKTWRLFVGASVESFVLAGTATPQSGSTVSACIGSTLNTAGGIRAGAFNGRIDEVRIWNTALTVLDPAEVSSGVGLVGRWGFGDASGTSLSNSISGGVNGTIVNNSEWVTGFNEADPTTNASLDFNGVHDYVTFGPALPLNTSTFSLEAWIYREGTGVTTVTSGAGGGGFEGLTAAVPIVTKGRGEGESPANINMNYFMGLVGNKLAADFEEAAGPNHSVIGNATIPLNTWTHVAATYEPVTAVWNLYINGALDKTLDIGNNISPVNPSIQNAAIGSALTSTGVADGFFDGKIDEVRIWNRALPQAEIQGNMNNEITSGSGLLGRWGFNENGDSTLNNSVAGGANGVIRSNSIYTYPTNGAAAWVSSGFVPVTTTISTTTVATPASIVYGTTSVTLTTTSSPNPGGGTIQFYVDGVAVGSPVSINTVTGTATLSTYNPSVLNAGSHVIRGDFSGFGTYAAVTGTNGTLTITPKPLTITGLTGNNKIYDGTVAATVTGTAALNGVIASDASNVILGGAPSATFATSGVGTGKPVTVTGYTISGSASGNYTLTQPSTLTANITTKTLTASLTGTVTKAYDGTTAATLAAGNYVLAGIIAGDVVTLNNPVSGIYDTKNVGTGKGITVSGLTISGSGAGNYSLSSAVATANIGTITAKILTVSLTGTVTKVYDGTTNATLIAGNYSLTGVTAPDVVTLNNPASGTYSAKDVGTSIAITVNGLVISGADAGNYSLSSTSATGNIGTITALVLNYSGTKVYDGTATFTAAQITITNIIAPDVVTITGSATVTGSVVGIYNGNFATNSLISTNSNYASVGGTGTRNFTITPKLITVTATAGQSKIYGAANPVYVYTNSPALIGADAFSGSLSRVAGENVGSYAITQGTLTLSSNYTITFVSNNFAITTKPITVTVTGGQSKAFGAADPVFTYTFSPALIVPDIFTGALTRVAGESTGTYAINQGTLSAGSNYTITFVSNTFAITDKTITVTVTAGQNKIYGSADPVYAYTFSPALTPPDVFAGSLGRVAGENVGSYAITLGTLTAGSNYTIIFVTTNLAITSKSITASLTGTVTKVYDGTTSATLAAGNYTLPGVIAPDVVTLNNPASGTYASKNVGTGIAVSVAGLTISGSGAGNYSLSSTSASGTIGTITALVLNYSGTKVYDGSPTFLASQITMTNIVVGDVVPLSGNANVAGSNVGAYNSTFAVNNLTTTNTNYASVGASGTRNFTITAKPITVTTTAGQSKVYGSANPVYVYTASPVLIGADAFSGALTRVAGENVGNYAISQGTLTAGSNYVITFVSNNFAITAKPITVTVTAGQSKIFGAADPLYAYTFSPVLSGPDAFSGVLTRVAGENVGNYSISQGTLTAGSNYTITFVANNFTITNKTVTVTVTAGQAKVYGAANPVYAYTFSPALTFPDVFTGALTRVAGENVGNYAISQGTLTPGSNYTVIFVTSTFAVTPKSLTLTADIETRIYGDPDPAFTGTIAGFIAGENQATATTGTLTFTSPSSITSNVGSYAITGSGLTANNGNYTFVQAVSNSTAFTITKRSLDFSGARIFDGTVNFSSAQLTSGNVVNSDVLTLAGLATVSSPSAGTYSSFVTSTLTTSNSNYQTTGGTVNVSIEIVPLTNHKSIRFTDTSYVDLGNAASLHLTNFTVEAWIKIEGYASTTQSGSTGVGGGQDLIVPIITKGRAEQELATVDVNYFLSYRSSDRKLIADFEDNATSLNHSVVSAATLPMNTWVHVGASFDVSTQTWRLFIDNNAAETFVLSGGPYTPQSLSNVNAAIGSTLNSAGGIRQGFFNGRIDEVRIWNTALTALSSGELTTTPANLVGRWAFDEGIGSVVANAVSGGASGTLINKTEWVSGFNVADSTTDASIRFNGIHDYVSFGAAPGLNTSAFTLEGWIYKEGTGITTNTGTGGIDGVPIIAKGRAEDETTTHNMNYFLGINSSNRLVADFEEATGPNHPVTGNTIIPNDAWTHVAVTYEPVTGTWNLYINGTLDRTLNIGAGITPVTTSAQYASIGSALTSGGLADGFFNGKIDEVRIWNRALSASELEINSACSPASTINLLGYWNFNENGNVTANNSVSGGVNGSLISNNISLHPTNGGPSWACNGSAGIYRSKNATGTWTTATDWETFNGSTWATATRPPTYTDNVTISSSTSYTINNPVSCNNLTVNTGGKLYRNGSAINYISVYGHIVCNGTIGNGATTDGISFNIEGDSCSISGNGTFDCSRIKKSCNGHATTKLTFNRDANLRFNGTALYNDISSTLFIIKIPSGITVNCPGDGTANSGGNFAMDGANGADFGYNAGSLTVDGTLNLSGIGSATPTLYLTNSNANVAWPVSVTIDSTGIINAGIINCSASGAAGHSFTIMGGGRLNITGEPATYTAPSLANNNYTLNSGSTIEYSKAGNQTVYTFGSINYSNLFGSGSGTKSIIAPLGVSDTIELKGTSILASGGNLTLLSSATKTARVAALPAGTNVTGDVTVERYIATGTGSAPNHGKSWQLLAVPISGTQTIKQSWQDSATVPNQSRFSGYGTQLTSNVAGAATQPTPGFDVYTSAGPSIKTYNYLTNGYDGPATTQLPVYNQKGYFVFVRGDRTVTLFNQAANKTILRTKGVLFTPTTPPPVTTVVADKFESIGNPYASALDMRNIAKTGSVDEFFTVWDPRLGGAYNYGAFQTFSKSGSDYYVTPGGGSYGAGGSVSNYIQSGQAFFVQTTGGSGTVSFTESSKASGSALFSRPSYAPGIQQMLRTGLYNFNSDGSVSLVDGVLNNFDDIYSNTVDGLDARKSFNTGENLSIKTAGQLLVIERMHTLAEQDTIFLNLTGLRSLPYQFQFTAANLNASGLEGFVEDNYLHSRTPVNLSGTTVINFNIVNIAGSYAPDRFRIVFSTAAILPVTFSSIKAYREDKNVKVEWTVENETNIKRYEVEKSTNGTQFVTLAVRSATANNGTAVMYTAEDRSPATGYNYYRVKSIDINGKSAYSNVVKVLVGSIKKDVTISPESVTDNEVKMHFINQPGGSYGVRLLNKLGQVIASELINHVEGSSTEVIKWDYRLAHGIYQVEVTKGGAIVKNINVMY